MFDSCVRMLIAYIMALQTESEFDLNLAEMFMCHEANFKRVEML